MNWAWTEETSKEDGSNPLDAASKEPETMNKPAKVEIIKIRLKWSVKLDSFFTLIFILLPSQETNNSLLDIDLSITPAHPIHFLNNCWIHLQFYVDIMNDCSSTALADPSWSRHAF